MAAAPGHPHDRAVAVSDDALRVPPPVIAPGHTFVSVTDKISGIVLTKETPIFWLAGFFVSFLLVLVLLAALGYLFAKGVGIWGINQPVGCRPRSR